MSKKNYENERKMFAININVKLKFKRMLIENFSRGKYLGEKG